ncbi:MAG TPA: phosphoenolpyruvate kinase [Polyangiales bacterium]|nr:phosphoenolpyruvate kinase [Polyangiales bacterium]
MSIVEQAKAELETLGRANRAFMKIYPGDRAARQPVHTVYGGAQLYKADTTRRLGELALRSMKSYARDPDELARGLGLKLAPAVAEKVYARVLHKLETEAVEDFRIDFEDGFGARSDEEEDATAIAAAKEAARGLAEGILPPFLGIRVKSFGEEWKLRGARTFELFFDTLLSATGGKVPENFVVTLPKITVAEQASTLVRLFELMEAKHRLPSGTFKMEMMIEVTQALLGPDGRSPLPGFLAACAGRCTGAHLGTYDFTASCNITAAYQVMDHWMCDQAKAQMMFAYAGTGVFLSDGATNVMPVGPHKSPGDATQEDDNRSSVHAAWRLASRHIRHSLEGGFYQGWDLHPAQLPVRYATCYAFFLEGFDPAAERLRNFVEKSAQATLVGDVFDDAATGQGLLNYFLRALNCGAITLDDVAQTGLTQEEFALRSFAKILNARRERLGK